MSQMSDENCQPYYRYSRISRCHVDMAGEGGSNARGPIHTFLLFLGEEWCPQGAKLGELSCPVQGAVFWTSLRFVVIFYRIRALEEGVFFSFFFYFSPKPSALLSGTIFDLLWRAGFSPCIRRKHGINDIDWMESYPPSCLWNLN